MNRRRFLQAAGLSTASIILPSYLSASPNRRTTALPSHPNILFILIDDMGWADLPCYGNRFHETPNIDRLAAQGMRFTDAYAACPVCSPTRASVLAGQYPARIGITDFIPGHPRPWARLTVPNNRLQMPLETVTIAEALKHAGYITGHIGKWHLGPKGFGPENQGFDFVRTSGPNRNDKQVTSFTDFAIEFIRANKDRKFFLYLAHHTVHIPLQAPQSLIDKYHNKPKPPTGPNNPIYAAMIEHLDTQIGRILETLDELDIADRTMVVFFSDNGGLRKRFDGKGSIVTTNAPLRDEKGTLYEGGIRVPLIIRYPALIKPGTTCSEPVSSVDFYPTFLQIADAPAPAQPLDGESLLPLLTRTGRLRRDAIYWHYPHYHHSTPAGAIRQGRWKLLEFFEDNHLELYDLLTDISETTNLARTMPQKAAELRKKLAVWRNTVAAKTPTPNPNYDPDRAALWGYHTQPARPKRQQK